MNNLYRKVAVASVCSALSFALGANKEVKAVTLTTLTIGPTSRFSYTLGDYETKPPDPNIYVLLNNRPNSRETRAFHEFNLLNLFRDTNRVINHATLRGYISDESVFNDLSLGFFNYYREIQLPYYSTFSFGPNTITPSVYNVTYPVYIINGEPRKGSAGFSFDVTDAINNLRDYSMSHDYNPSIAGFGIGGNNNEIKVTAYLEMEVVTLPEPTTIFGSALALGVGGWLKRKKSSRQNKTMSPH